MGMLMIKCPQTGKLVYTGIDIDKKSLETATLTNNAVGCPECGQRHMWSKQDAQLVERKR